MRRFATFFLAAFWLAALELFAFWYGRLLGLHFATETIILIAAGGAWFLATAFFFHRLWVRLTLSALLGAGFFWALVNFAYYKIFGVFLPLFSSRLKSLNLSVLHMVGGFASTIPWTLFAAAAFLVLIFFFAVRIAVPEKHDEVATTFSSIPAWAKKKSFRIARPRLSLVLGFATQLCAFAAFANLAQPVLNVEQMAKEIKLISGDSSLIAAKSDTATLKENLNKLAGKKTEKATATRPTPPPLTHIIFYQMESVDAWALGQDPTPMPYLQSLMDKYGSVQNYFAPGCTTVDAEFASLCGYLPETYGPVSDLYSKNSYNCLPSILKDRGYGTYLYHANNPSFWARDALGPAWGFDNLIFEPTLSYHQPDSLTFDKVVEDLKTNAGRPTFQYVIGITAHAPHNASALNLYKTNFATPVEPYSGELNATSVAIDAEVKTKRDYLGLLTQTDNDLKHLFDRLAAEGLDSSTVVAIYGDHRYYQSKSGDAAQDFFAYNRIPMVLVAPGAEKTVWPGIASHLDLAPTIMDYLSQGKETLPDTFLGTSLFSPAHRDLMLNKCLGRVSSYNGSLWAEVILPDQKFESQNFFGTASASALDVVKENLVSAAVTSDLLLARDAIGKIRHDDEKVVSGNKFTDTDGDGLSDLREQAIETDPENPDTDGDGFSDGEEVANGFDPLGPGKKILE